MVVAFISCICMYYCLLFYTIPNETWNIEGITLSEYINFTYHNNHPDFNYFNGLWLSFAGIFFTMILMILNVPNPFTLIEKYEKKLIEKIKRKKKKS